MALNTVIHWAGEDKSIIVVSHRGTWDWADCAQVLEICERMAGSVRHPVDVLFDVSGVESSLYMLRDISPLLCKSISARHIRRMIYVGAGSVLRGGLKIIEDLSDRLFVCDDRAEALRLLSSSPAASFSTASH